jgi:hypothetical protein
MQALVGTGAAKVCPVVEPGVGGLQALATELFSAGGLGVSQTSQPAVASGTVPDGDASKKEYTTLSPGLASAGSPRTARRV